jgi:hypothetical protein
MTPTCHSLNPLSLSHKPLTATAYAAALSPGFSIPLKCPIVMPTGHGLLTGDDKSALDVGVAGPCEWMNDVRDVWRRRREKGEVGLEDDDSIER